MYENIKNLGDLITEVRAHGFNTALASIKNAADIIANTSEGDLIRIAYDDRQSFFQIVRYTWPMADAIDFYLKYCSTRVSQLEQAKAEVEERADKAAKRIEQLENERVILLASKDRAEADVRDREEECRSLRRLLFDEYRRSGVGSR